MSNLKYLLKVDQYGKKTGLYAQLHDIATNEFYLFRIFRYMKNLNEWHIMLVPKDELLNSGIRLLKSKEVPLGLIMTIIIDETNRQFSVYEISKETFSELTAPLLISENHFRSIIERQP